MPAPSYHPPQFSEDSTWLPAWLQPHRLPFSVQQIGDCQVISPDSCKDALFLPEKISSRAEGNFSEGAARYSGCHLFLSGDDSSPVASTPSSGNVLHFHLHLSSDGISQNTLGESHDVCRSERPKSNKFLYNQKTPEASVFRDDRGSGACIKDSTGSTCLPKIPQESFLASLSKDNRKSRKKLQGKFDSGHLQNTDIPDAVELSIAASEALVISELLNIDSPEVFPAATALEIALRVKQARNQYHDGLVYEPACPKDDFDENDWLSDMDENTLVNAYEDVGLSVTPVVTSADELCCFQTFPAKYQNNSCNSTTKHEPSSYVIASHVLNTENHKSKSECDGEVENTKVESQDVNFIGIKPQENLADALATDSWSKKPQQECPGMWEVTYGDGLSGSDSNQDSHLNTDSNQLVQTTVDHLLGTEILSKEDGISLKIHNKENAISSLSIADSEKADAENAINYANIFMVERFRSRWFGGWTVKDVETPVCEGQNNTKNMLNGVEVPICEGQNKRKNMPKLFTGESSFLSESMDAFSEKSSAYNPGAGFKRVASSCTPVVAIPENADEGIMFSQGIVGSSNFSVADPLCSIVPCSISLDEDHTVQPSGQRIFEEEVGKGSNRFEDYVGLETACLRPPAQREGNVASRMSKEGLTATIRKQLTSLRMYSMVEPVCYRLAAGNLGCVNELGPLVGPSTRYRGLIPFERNVDCFVSLNKEEEDSTLHLKGKQSERKKPNLVNYGKNDTSPAKELLLEQTVRNISEVTDGADMMQVCQFEQSSSSVILNYGTRHKLRAHKNIVNDTEKGELDRSCIPSKRKSNMGVSSTGVSGMDRSKDGFALLESSLHSHPHENLRTASKRVRFAEPENHRYCSKTVKRLSVGHQGSCKRTGKRPYRLGSMFAMGREDYNCLKGCCTKCRKGLLFQGLEFLLTGCSRKKEKELELLIRKHGGSVLSDVPSPPPYFRRKRESRQQHWVLPIVLSPKKVETTKFLYGCAIGSFLLRPNWLSDSLLSGSILSLDKYFILPNQASNQKQMKIGQRVRYNNGYRIFNMAGIMLYGKPAFCSKFAKIIKHGGGQVFKSLHSLDQSLKKGKNSVGVVVFEDDSRALRHLKYCASEQELQLMPASWIINSLFMGKLLPFKKNDQSTSPMVRRVGVPPSMDLSKEV